MGFLLPLALNVALLLLLSSLLLVSLALQGRLQAAVQRQRRLAADQLMSAAQRWAGRVQLGCPEALAVDAVAWNQQPWITTAGCAGLETGEGYGLVSYTPSGSPEQGTGELVLELTGAESAPRGAFALLWRRELPADVDSTTGGAGALAGTPRLEGLEERGLRASAADAGEEVAP